MKTNRTLIAGLLLTASSLNAQNFEWAKSFGSTFTEEGRAIAVDASGNVYSTGYFRETADLDPGVGTDNHTSLGNEDIYVQKLDASGNFLWAKAFGSFNGDVGNAISVDASGNVFTTGYFQGTVDFDPGAGTTNLTAVGAFDYFIQKLDASGNFLWAKAFGSNLTDMAYGIAVDDLGNVYTTGYFSETIDFDPGAGTTNLTAVGTGDAFIQKLDAAGNLIWAKTFGSINTDYGRSIKVDAAGNVYTTGYFELTVDFDPGAGTTNLTSVGGADVFVQKLDVSGNLIWAKTFGGTTLDEGHSISVDNLGNVITVGQFNGSADFDPGPVTNSLSAAGGGDVFIQKMDASGNFLWANSFGTTTTELGHSCAVDQFGNIYTTGYFSGTVDFDPGVGTDNLTSAGSADIFIQKLDPAGNLLWVHSIGNGDSDRGLSISADASGNVYTTGYFYDTVDFDPGTGTSNLTSVGSWDVFIQKMSQCLPTSGTDIQNACVSFTWIDGNNYTANNNTATFTLINSGGCDSIVALNLTINQPTTGTDVQMACNNFTWIDGIAYFASNNSATFTLTNAAGCDSVVTLNLTINSVTDVTTTFAGDSITANNANASYRWLDCDNNFAEITGQTNQSFTPATNGNYAVELTENGCVDTSACVAITTVGSIEIGKTNVQILYPNPSNGNLNVNLGRMTEDVRILITDLSGKQISNQTYNDCQTVNLSLNVTSGLYLMTVRSKDTVDTYRLMIE